MLHFPQVFFIWQSLGSEVSEENTEVVKKSDIIFLSVKPFILPKVLTEIKPLSSDKLFISIAMGVTLNQLEKVFIHDLLNINKKF